MTTPIRDDDPPGARGAGVYIAFGVIVVLAAIVMFVVTGAFRGRQLPREEPDPVVITPDATTPDALRTR